MKASARSSSVLPLDRLLQRAMVAVSRQAERDIELLLGGDRPKRVHALRLRMKKLHALLSLIESRVTLATMESIRRNMRTLKMAFARNRDQFVIEALLAEMSHEKSAVAKAYVCVDDKTAPEAWLHELKATASSLTHRLQGLRLRSLTAADVSAAYVRNYSKARRRYKRCKQKPSPKKMHRWRLLVKDHYFQTLILLHDRCRCELARKLGRFLGKIHDYELLWEHLNNGMSDDLVSAIDTRMKKLRARAFRKARRLFAMTPTKLRSQLLAAWPAPSPSPESPGSF